MTMGGYSGDGARHVAAAASADASSAKREVGEMEHEIARLKLVCAACWELLKEKTALTEEELMAKVQEIDARDGIMDGQLKRSIRKCVQCQRTVPAKNNKCMYCGTVQPVSSVFESL